MGLRRICHLVLPKRIRSYLFLIYLFFTDRKRFKKSWYYRLHKVRYGKDNPKIHFFVIRRDPQRTGLLACYICALGHLIDIDEKVSNGKLTPVMDMYTEYYSLIHNDESEKMRINAWEHYFQPFSNYSMCDVLHSKKVTLSFGYEVDSALQFFHNNEFNEEIVKKYLPIHNKYFHLREELKEQFDKLSDDMFGNKRVLGTNVREGYMVLAHGRDHNEKSYAGEYIKGHPTQPDIEVLCNMLEEKMKEWNCEYLFAECQTTYVEEKIRARFGNRFLCSDHKRMDVKELSLDAWQKAVPQQRNGYGVVQNDIDYLKSIYLLSKCTALFAPKSSGTVVASFWNNGNYDYFEIIDNGIY